MQTFLHQWKSEPRFTEALKLEMARKVCHGRVHWSQVRIFELRDALLFRYLEDSLCMGLP